MKGERLEKLPIVGPEDAERRFAQARCLVEHRIENRHEVARRRIDDLQHLRGRGLPLVCLLQLQGENAYLLLKVGNGWGCDRSFASFGPTHTPTLDRLFAS